MLAVGFACISRTSVDRQLLLMMLSIASTIILGVLRVLTAAEVVDIAALALDPASPMARENLIEDANR